MSIDFKFWLQNRIELSLYEYGREKLSEDIVREILTYTDIDPVAKVQTEGKKYNKKCDRILIVSDVGVAVSFDYFYDSILKACYVDKRSVVVSVFKSYA